MAETKQAVRGADWLPPREAAAMLGISPKTLARWADEGRLPCLVTLGGHRRFSRQAIEQLAAQMVKPEAS